MFPGERRAGDEGAMGHRIAAADNRPPRPERSLASRLVIAISILLVVAGLLFLGWVYAIGQLLGDPAGGPYFHIQNRTSQTLKIIAVLDGGDTFVYSKIPPHSSVWTGDDCGSVQMIAKTGDGMEIAHRGPFDRCNLETWVIREPSYSDVM